ncbi:hypothetical protein ACIQW4_01430 [Streptomyces albogriseolus]|uniref:hypothetical protein n=1 Tax=Streptomyces albogriseolus TaxID=1887 RepID=UPI003815A0AC
MANVTVDEKELATLRLAAKFLAEHGEQISYYNQYAMEILKMQAPNATLEAAMRERETMHKISQELEVTLEALTDAGFLD